MGDVDVAIIGGGVVGAAIAARLSMTSARVRLYERNDDVADEASKGNAGITSSYYAEPGSLDAEVISATYRRWEDVCLRLDVPFRRIGGLITALSEEEEERLPPKLDEALGCGVRAEIVSGERARELEPLISPQCRRALWLPEEGIIDPMCLTVRLAELAAANGADVRLGAPVIGFERSGDRVVGVRTPTGVDRVGFVVNAAGLALGTISELAGGECLRLWPRKGEYWLLDRRFGSRLRHIVFATPLPDTKGIHVVPTTNGTALLGPSVEDNDRPTDKETDGPTLDYIFERARRMVPAVSLDLAIKSFAAIRPASDERIRVRVDGRVSNLVHAGNRSTGVSSSLGMADMVLELLRGAGLDAEERLEAVDRLTAVPRLLAHPEPETLTDIDPRYGQVVCVCEQVSAAEIAAALQGPLGARSIDGIRKRTRATGGRCQGAVCMAGVAFMCSIATGRPPGEIEMVAGGTFGV
ncbi:MAG TPA: NAD(P)/FAD-dependent oxidoreductase [Candidatus Dormibacteraeota bacterium]|nr:NAD(P)/FAD-dependent oxidoreductase [Candidatus Dormibacteraeota bacterium]